MSHLTALPSELLEDIIHHTHTTSPESLAALSLTCRRLQIFVRARQWKCIVVPWRLRKISAMGRFIEAHRGNEAINCVRLVPQVAILNAFRVKMDSAFHHLDGLCETLTTLSRLTTFSIFLDGQVELRCQMPGQVLARIVRALPPSLANLEIDTEGSDRIWDDNITADSPSHLCVAISERIPQLETLWLRLSCLCTDLFGSIQNNSGPRSISTLRRVFIRLDTSPGREIHIDINDRVGDCHLPTSARKHTSAQGSHDMLKVEKLFESLLDLQATGAFPNIERFALYSWVDVGNKKRRFIRVRDVATRTITHYPMAAVRDLNARAFWTKDDSTLSVIRDHECDYFFGDRKDQERAILSDMAWTETENGVRLPPNTALMHTEPRLKTEELLSCQQVVEEQMLDLKYTATALAADIRRGTQILDYSSVVVERM